MDVLIIEDEPNLLESLIDGLSGALPGYFFEGAANVEEGKELIRHKVPSLIISDIRLPGKDGVDFFMETTLKFPKIKFILMSAYPVPENLSLKNAPNLLQFIRKPFDLMELVNFVKDTLNMKEFQRSTNEIPLIDTLKIMNFAKRTVALAIRQGEKNGDIFIKAGEVIHAVWGSHEGLEALGIIAGWNNTRIRFKEQADAPKQTIDKPFQMLIERFFDNSVNGEAARVEVPGMEKEEYQTPRAPPANPNHPKTSNQTTKFETKGKLMANLETLFKHSKGITFAVRADEDGNLHQSQGEGDGQGLAATVFMCNSAVSESCEELGLDDLQSWVAVVGGVSIYVHLLGEGFVAAMGKKTKNPYKTLKEIAEELLNQED